MIVNDAYAGSISRAGNKLFYKGVEAGFELPLTPSEWRFLGRADILDECRRSGSVAFEPLPTGDLLATTGSLKAVVTPYTLIAFHEIFVAQLYGLSYTQPCIAIDIGANVGYATLLLAQMENVKKVYAFEPFPETYQAAMVNFGHNPALHAKISPQNYGLGTSDQVITAQYAQEVNAGLRTIGEVVSTLDGYTLVDRTVRLRNASDCLSEIVAENPGSQIIAKIDCEGMEYEIFRVWEEHDLLRHLTIVMMEWHDNGPGPLVKRLERNGFTVFSPHMRSRVFPMIYAVRNP